MSGRFGWLWRMTARARLYATHWLVLAFASLSLVLPGARAAEAPITYM